MEKRYRILNTGILMVLLCPFFTIPAFANSSWRWLAETRPYDVLPYVIAITVGVETAALVTVAKVSKIGKAFCFVSLANLLSFLAPYVLEFAAFRMDRLYPSFSYYLEQVPVYTVGIAYAVMTLAVELPLLSAALKKDTDSRGRLHAVIIGANLLTTAITFLVEHVFCPGRW